MFLDYYKILEIPKTATPAEIKKAYRKLARKHHPDLHPNDNEAKLNFQKINEANEVLSDPEKRKKYDKYGKDWEHSENFENMEKNRQQSSNSRRQSYTGAQSEDDFSDFFSSMFGGASSSGRSRQVKYRGQDYNAELHLNLTDAYETHKRTLTVNDKNIRITIPAGVENGQTIKLPGHGGPGMNGGPNGDLYIKFSISNDTQFKRLGNDLYSSIDLDLYIAVLGGEIIVDTLKGKVKLKVQPETQNGSMIKLKGKGFPVYKSDDKFGDLNFTYNIKIPTNLTEKQKELFIELSNSKS